MTTAGRKERDPVHSSTEPSDDDIASLVATVQAVMERHFDPAEGVLRADAGPVEIGADPVWSVLTSQLDLGMLAVPASSGGYGMSLEGLSAVFGTFGRTLYPGPVTVRLALVPYLLGRIPGVSQDEVRSAGSGLTGLIVDGAGAGIGGSVTSRTTDGGVRLTGSASALIDARDCASFLVVARSEDGVVLGRLGTDATGVTCTPRNSLDPTRALTDVQLTDVEVEVLATGADVERARDATVSVAAVLVAAQQVAAAQRCLEIAVDYATIREQFGRPIGSFQAIKHACADTYVAVEVMASFVPYVASQLDVECPNSPLLAALKSKANRTGVAAAEQAIQVLGGIGFTWEHVAHLYLKRAVADAQLILGAPKLRARMVDGVRTFDAIEHVVAYA